MIQGRRKKKKLPSVTFWREKREGEGGENLEANELAVSEASKGSILIVNDLPTLVIPRIYVTCCELLIVHCLNGPPS